MSVATPAAVAAPAESKGGATATALYDYEAAGEFEVIFCVQLMMLTLLQRTMNSAFQMVPKLRTLCVFFTTLLGHFVANYFAGISR
jgi:hypothetical protein